MTEDLTPEEEAEVSRLLSESAGPVTMPASVSARLDDVLAGLVTERTEPLPSTLGEVVPIRHRRWPQVLVAAAAVSVFGYVGSVLMTQQSGSDEMATADAGAAAEVTETFPEAAAPGADDSDGQLQGELAPGARALNDVLQQSDLFSAYRSTQQDAAKSTLPCQPPLGVDPAAVRVTQLRGDTVVVVVRTVSATTSRADVYPCVGGIFPIASTLLLDAE